MNDLLTWMLGSVLGLGAAWALYRGALRAERCFGYNRVFLLLAPLVAAGLPLLPRPALGWLASAPAPGAPTAAGAAPAFVLPTLHVQASGWAADWGGVSPLVWLYAAGVALGLGRLAWRLGRLHRATRGLPRTAGPDYALAHTGGRLPTSSFGRTIFWDDTAALAPAEAAQVLAHEAAHVRQGHTYDVLWLESWRAVLWFNPFIYPLVRALALTHELLADRAALAETNAPAAAGPQPGPTAYATLLARLATRRITLPEAPLPLLHSFTHSLTLTRIAMLKSSHPVRRWKQWLALPVVAGLLAVACQPAADVQTPAGMVPPPSPPVASSDAQAHLNELSGGSKVYQYVEEMPHLPSGNGVAGIVTAIQESIQYPTLAAADQKDGRVFVSFVVTKDGAVKEPKIIKGLGPAYDAAVVTAVTKLPAFLPGRQDGIPVNVSFTVPIKFERQP
ncbi:M56 family metallopeptidase [Hymenobacter nivis]|uniref:TonB family protein n=1 Tax=Hymenobacter nivis TaxID=1850093 RepID=A0A502H1C6_9BACT|nr:M56 family metallopeptidase [Hymenobacter nivis]TPG67113.1 TonB family protein [Hymenobacter nivis]